MEMVGVVVVLARVVVRRRRVVEGQQGIKGRVIASDVPPAIALVTH